MSNPIPITLSDDDELGLYSNSSATKWLWTKAEENALREAFREFRESDGLQSQTEHAFCVSLSKEPRFRGRTWSAIKGKAARMGLSASVENDNATFPNSATTKSSSLRDQTRLNSASQSTANQGIFQKSSTDLDSRIPTTIRPRNYCSLGYLASQPRAPTRPLIIKGGLITPPFVPLTKRPLDSNAPDSSRRKKQRHADAEPNPSPPHHPKPMQSRITVNAPDVSTQLADASSSNVDDHGINHITPMQQRRSSKGVERFDSLFHAFIEKRPDLKDFDSIVNFIEELCERKTDRITYLETLLANKKLFRSIVDSRKRRDPKILFLYTEMDFDTLMLWSMDNDHIPDDTTVKDLERSLEDLGKSERGRHIPSSGWYMLYLANRELIQKIRNQREGILPRTESKSGTSS